MSKIVYLVQHGKAVRAEDDPARPLTAAGRDEVHRLAQVVGVLAPEVAHVMDSGKVRARQTADLLAAGLPAWIAPEKRDGLAPNDDPGVAQRIIEETSGAVLVVGHLPHLSRLASTLLLGAPTPEVIAFRNASLVRMSRGDDDRWRVDWIFRPGFAALSDSD